MSKILTVDLLLAEQFQFRPGKTCKRTSNACRHFWQIIWTFLGHILYIVLFISGGKIQNYRTIDFVKNAAFLFHFCCHLLYSVKKSCKERYCRFVVPICDAHWFSVLQLLPGVYIVMCFLFEHVSMLGIFCALNGKILT